MTDKKQKNENIGNSATSQQRLAADPAHSVWVEASAGTGKTKVLSDRVFRLLLNSENPHPERILCLTYTVAGSVQMKSRIYQRLSKWAVMNDAELEKSLTSLFSAENLSLSSLKKYKKRARTLFAVLLDTPGGIKIQTIHSFCQDILSRFPIEAGVSPYFDIIEPEEQKDILEQIRRDLLIEAETNPQSLSAGYMRYITENMSEDGFIKALKDIIESRAKLQNLFGKYPDFGDFEAVLAQKLEVNPKLLIADICHNAMTSVSDILSKIIDALNHGSGAEKTKAAALQNIVNKGYQGADFEILKKNVLTGDNTQSIKGTKDSKAYNPEIPELGKIIAEKINDASHKVVRQKLFFSSQTIFGLAHEMFRKYEEYKKKRAKLDYNDLVFATDNLLSNPYVADWVLYKLDGGIDHILVDEAQDTSPEQWKIIGALSKEFFSGEGSKTEPCTVFVVGDKKQSIFSFQGADPQKMKDMLDYFLRETTGNLQVVNLDISFRSTSAVLDMVNKIFSVPEACSGVTLDDKWIEHISYRSGEFGKVVVWPLLTNKKDKEKNKEADEEEQKPYATQTKSLSLKYRLAQKITEKIKELMEKSRNTPRPMQFRDFMVLVQKRAHFADDFIRACKEAGVNVTGADRMNLTGQITVQDLISLAKFLLLPNDDLSLAEVLKSPIFNLTDDDLFKLCYNRGNANLWSRLHDFPEYDKIYTDLQILLNQIDYIRPYELFNYVLTKFGGRHKFITRIGYEAEDPIDEFINLTLAFERNHIPSLQNFVEWLSSHNIEIKRESKQNDIDAVRLMTAHGSKGLQARVVFLPDTTIGDGAINEQKVLFDDREDVAYYPLCAEYYEENSVRTNQRIAQKEAEERRRLLYVALTRAEDELYICGYGSSAKEAPETSWYALCNNALKQCGKEQPDGSFVYQAGDKILPPKETYADLDNTIPAVQSWLNEDAKPENPLSKPYTPSKFDEDDDDSVSPLADNGDFYTRGTLIHRLLQFLPNKKENRRQIIEKYLQNSNFGVKEQKQIADEVSAVLENPEFADIFGENSRAEVPIMGEIDGKIISAQIDRLIVLPDKVKIVDFKTNRHIEETPIAYIKQLATYAELISKIYPNKKIETYILWTNKLKLSRIS